MRLQRIELPHSNIGHGFHNGYDEDGVDAEIDNVQMITAIMKDVEDYSTIILDGVTA
jgi:hypothetical protein